MSNIIYILISIYFNNSCANLVIFYLIAKKTRIPQPICILFCDSLFCLFNAKY